MGMAIAFCCHLYKGWNWFVRVEEQALINHERTLTMQKVTPTKLPTNLIY